MTIWLLCASVETPERCVAYAHVVGLRLLRRRTKCAVKPRQTLCANIQITHTHTHTPPRSNLRFITANTRAMTTSRRSSRTWRCRGRPRLASTGHRRARRRAHSSLLLAAWYGSDSSFLVSQKGHRIHNSLASVLPGECPWCRVWIRIIARFRLACLSSSSLASLWLAPSAYFAAEESGILRVFAAHCSQTDDQPSPLGTDGEAAAGARTRARNH